jgi:hypothetical protein
MASQEFTDRVDVRDGAVDLLGRALGLAPIPPYTRGDAPVTAWS